MKTFLALLAAAALATGATALADNYPYWESIGMWQARFQQRAAESRGATPIGARTDESVGEIQSTPFAYRFLLRSYIEGHLRADQRAVAQVTDRAVPNNPQAQASFQASLQDTRVHERLLHQDLRQALQATPENYPAAREQVAMDYRACINDMARTAAVVAGNSMALDN